MVITKTVFPGSKSISSAGFGTVGLSRGLQADLMGGLWGGKLHFARESGTSPEHFMLVVYFATNRIWADVANSH